MVFEATPGRPNNDKKTMQKKNVEKHSAEIDFPWKKLKKYPQNTSDLDHEFNQFWTQGPRIEPILDAETTNLANSGRRNHKFNQFWTPEPRIWPTSDAGTTNLVNFLKK